MKAAASWSDFEKLDIRVGTIVSAEDFPEAKKPAYKLKIDFGEQGVLKSSAQITHHYTLSSLEGMQVIAVVNFPPKQVGTFMSECRVLGIYTEDMSVVLLSPGKPVKNGCRLG